MEITRVISGPQGLFSNTYLLQAPGGVIVVDPPMLLSDARAVTARVQEARSWTARPGPHWHTAWTPSGPTPPSPI